MLCIGHQRREKKNKQKHEQTNKEEEMNRVFINTL